MTAELWERAGIWLVLALVLASLRGLDRWLMAQRSFPDVVEPQVKTYPEGCTCIRGAMLDNPSCPHHGGDHEWTA